MRRLLKFFTCSVCTAALLAGNGAWAQTTAAPVVSAQAAVARSQQATVAEAAQLLRQGRPAEVVSMLRGAVNSQDQITRAQSRYVLALAFDGLGQPAEGLNTLEGTLQDATPLGKAVGLLRGQLMLQAAEAALMQGATDRAASFLRDYEHLSVQPDKSRFQRLTDMLDPPINRPSLAPLRVGVILPQHGPLGPAGIDLIRALQLGLPTFTAGGRRVELVVQHAETPAEATQAAKLLQGQKVNLVLGPLLANQVAAVAGAMGSTPILTLSSDGSALKAGVHTLNFLPGQQTARVAQAALAQGNSKVAALVPQGPYGEAALAGLRQTLAQGGGELVKASFFNPQEPDIGSSIRDLGKGFNALLVPTTGRTLPLIAAQLAYYDLDRGVQLLGTALWQDAAVLAPSARGLRGGQFAAPSRNAAFVESFTQTYGAAPHPLAALGYDAAAILAQLANETARSGNAVSQVLLRPEGFYAPGGFAKFTPNGQTVRSLALTEIGDGQFIERQPSLPLAPLPLPNPLIPEAGSRSWW